MHRQSRSRSRLDHRLAILQHGADALSHPRRPSFNGGSPSLCQVSYRSSLSAERVAELRRLHERAYGELTAPGERRLSYLGLDLVVLPGVFPPTPTSDLLGRAVLAETRPSDRVDPVTGYWTWAPAPGSTRSSRPPSPPTCWASTWTRPRCLRRGA